ncbi:hypothetical protein GCM10010922_27570 [Microbacterium sorbitolivorans]|nr:hypothetical protein GCM10010922_27570 [Microbacterium sorbitolivorans]
MIRWILTIAFCVAAIAAIVFGSAWLYRTFWGPGAFVERYIERLAVGDAAGALEMPGVAPEYSDLDAIHRGQASEVLLRSATLTSEIDDVKIVDEKSGDDGSFAVELSYTLDGSAAQMTFRVERDGFDGLVPSWRFEVPPLSVVDLTVRGSWRFSVNGFEMDKRQISPDGTDADPLAPVSMLAFTPGNYAVAVDTAATTASPTTVASASPLGIVPLDVQTVPTDELVDVVQKSVNDFLDGTCTTQPVLHPSGCPFGAPNDVSDLGIAQNDVAWEIVDYPMTRLVPDGDSWQVAPANGKARLTLTVYDYFTGALVNVERDVYFTMVADVDVREDGDVHITIDAV